MATWTVAGYHAIVQSTFEKHQQKDSLDEEICHIIPMRWMKTPLHAVAETTMESLNQFGIQLSPEKEDTSLPPSVPAKKQTKKDLKNKTKKRAPGTPMLEDTRFTVLRLKTKENMAGEIAKGSFVPLRNGFEMTSHFMPFYPCDQLKGQWEIDIMWLLLNYCDNVFCFCEGMGNGNHYYYYYYYFLSSILILNY